MNGSLVHIAETSQPAEVNTGDTPANYDLVKLVEQVADDTSILKGNHTVVVDKI